MNRFEQVATGRGQVGVHDNRIGRDPFAVRGVHRDGAAVRHLDPSRLGAVSHDGAVVRGGVGQRPRDGVHPACGKKTPATVSM